MSVSLRLSRGGSKKRPFYRIVAADKRSPRDGRFIERLGTYNPMKPKDSPERVLFDEERIKYWLSVGAQPTNRVAKFLSEKKLVEKPVVYEQTKKNKPKAKTLEKIKAKEEKLQNKQAQPAEAPKPAQEAQPAEAPKPAQEAQPAEAPKPAQEAQPAEAPKPAQEAQPAEAPKPAQEAQPAEAPKLLLNPLKLQNLLNPLKLQNQRKKLNPLKLQNQRKKLNPLKLQNQRKKLNPLKLQNQRKKLKLQNLR